MSQPCCRARAGSVETVVAGGRTEPFQRGLRRSATVREPSGAIARRCGVGVMEIVHDSLRRRTRPWFPGKQAGGSRFEPYQPMPTFKEPAGDDMDPYAKNRIVL